uniref:Uncharacterized protein n=2 Tax=Oryza sativa subsp. japonica TaxID=39947 RepID=Q10PL2_ORYSJ|nr:Hypothetical protein [Oryza sativa Japonica Group]ABF94783.1 hypothetical protein LOC_Os03g12870 [Oryza sativa Japonica Group]
MWPAARRQAAAARPARLGRGVGGGRWLGEAGPGAKAADGRGSATARRGRPARRGGGGVAGCPRRQRQLGSGAPAQPGSGGSAARRRAGVVAAAFGRGRGGWLWLGEASPGAVAADGRNSAWPTRARRRQWCARLAAQPARRGSSGSVAAPQLDLAARQQPRTQRPPPVQVLNRLTGSYDPVALGASSLSVYRSRRHQAFLLLGGWCSTRAAPAWPRVAVGRTGITLND